MSNQLVVTNQKQIKDLLTNPSVKTRFEQMLGKNASSFTTSVLQIINSNSMLQNADPNTVLSSALVAASLNLPINNSLGFAYIVPYSTDVKDGNGKKVPVLDENGQPLRNASGYIQYERKTEAQFQLGYKGFIQLAQRSGQFERIASAPVYEGQLIEADPLLGYKFDWKVEAKGEPIGYVAFFKLTNGFTAELYMTTAEIEKHAKSYSQSYKNDKFNTSIWSKDFKGMALKTVTKLLLSKQAPLSIDTPLTTAIQADQAVIHDVDGEQVFVYEDNQPTQPAIEMNLDNDPALLGTVVNQIQNGTLDKADVLSGNAGYVFANEATRQALAGA